MPYYHAAPIPLAPGSIILPGNWGRIISIIGDQHPNWELEQIFEAVRKDIFVQLPSRLACCYCTPNEPALRTFVERAAKAKATSICYEVELVDPGAPRHTTDYWLVNRDFTQAELQDRAFHYWTGEFRKTHEDRPDFRSEEILTLSPLRIIRPLDD